MEALQSELRPLMLRRVKEDVETSIPPRVETIIDVELTNIQKQYYRAVFEKNREFLSRSPGGQSVASLSFIEMELRKCCNHPYLLSGVEDRELVAAGMADPEGLQAGLHLIQSSGKTVLLDKLLLKLKSEGHKVGT